MKKIFSVLLLALITLFAFTTDRHDAGQMPISESRSKIVLIFRATGQQKQHPKGSFYTLNNARYYNDDLVRVEHELKNGLSDDKLTIYGNQAELPVDLFYNYITYNYHFKRGDSVIFSFKNDIPVVTFINRETKPYDVNYTLKYRQRFNKPLKGSNVLTFSREQLSTDRLYERLYNSYQQQDSYLDSLQREQQLSASVCDIYKQQAAYEFAGMLIVNPNFKSYADNFFSKKPLTQLVDAPQFLFDDFFHNFLVYQYLWSNYFGVKRISSGHGVSLDYPQAYQKIKANISDEKVRGYLLFYCLQQIAESNAKEVSNAYLKKFEEDVPDTIYASYLKENFYAAPASVSGASIITNLDKTKTQDFAQLVKTLHGNVVFVDLWASWCMPCRAAMPAADSLRQSYKNKPIKFVYLSIDSKYSDWKKGASDEALAAYQYSFLLEEPKTAPLVKFLSLGTIPRYLIYSKTGELVYKNAPGPDSPDLKTILNRYLNQ